MEIYPIIAEQLQDLDVGILGKPNVQLLSQLHGVVDWSICDIFL